jgi:prenyltransferase beta subunit
MVSVLILYAILAVSPLLAQSPQITNGLGYLTSSQNPDGAWTSATTLVETTAATVSALETLKLLNQTAGTSYTAGVSWLQGQSPVTVDYIAERIRALSLADGSANALIPSREPSKGAWGGFEGYELNNLDTTLALQALKAANYPDLSVSNTALAYLTNTQNSDGGWGFHPGNDSNVYMTAIVSATLQQFPQTDAIAAAITKATAYLTNWQNPDGGFGTSPGGVSASNVHETALAYSALVAVSTDAPLLGKVINYLTSAQAMDGSWGQDPYCTALALKALYLSENKPAPPPAAATTGSVMGTVVDSITNAPLTGVSAQLLSDPSFTATSNTTGLFALSGIPAGSQQIKITLAGYAPLTITAPISAGTFINVGRFGLSVNPTTGTVQGVVWDADENAPYPGVTVQAVSNGNMFDTYEALSGPDGSYKITGVTPGSVTVGTPSGPKPGYWNDTMTGKLAPGGILLYNPRMSKTPALTVNITAQADKTIYKQGETVALSFALVNSRATTYTGSLKVKVTDPSGAAIYSTSVPAAMTENGTTTQHVDFALSATAQSGFYTVQAELFDPSGYKKGTGTTTFGIFLSQIAVTPLLPDTLSSGPNTVTFNLSNTGNYAVSSGSLAVTLKDPDGVVITTSAQPFTLSKGENKSLTFALNLPALKFGDYPLTYTQSDETTPGQAKSITIANSIAVSAIFDKPSYRIRETANLLIKLGNTGRLHLDAVKVNVAVPDAGLVESKTVTIRQGETQSLVYTISLPASMTAAQHSASVTITLPSGAAISRTAEFSILDSSLSVSLSQSSFTAGDTIRPVISNNGGSDTQVQCKLSLFDSRSALIAEKSDTGAITAGSSLSLNLAIPPAVADGNYNLSINCKDMKTGKEEIVPNPITITGVKATLQVRTDKEVYLMTENIMGLSAITNSGTAPIQNGNLHLQVTTAGNQTQKTWSRQYDWQQGVRNGVDTYGVNDWIIPDDDFSEPAVNTDRWQVNDTTCLRSGAVLVDVSSTCSSVNGKLFLTGDFDIQVDFTSNNSYGEQGAQFDVIAPSFDFVIKNTQSNGYMAQARANGGSVGMNIHGSYAPSGKFRITRTGTTVVGYAWIGSAWVELLRSTSPQFADNCYAALEVWRAPGQPASATFDNFKVNSGRIATVNETVDSVRLLPLNDNFDDGAFNRDRWFLWGKDYVDESNGVLHLSSGEANVMVYDAIVHRNHFAGEYAAVTQYRNFVATNPPPPRESYSYFVMLAYDGNSYDANMNMFFARRVSGNNSEKVCGDSYVYGHGYTFGNPVPYSADSGLFRLRRVNTTGFADYWDGTQWVNLSSENRMLPTDHFIEIYTLCSDYKSSVAADVDNFYTDFGKYSARGTLNLKHDSGVQNNNWGNILFSASQPLDTAIKFRTRTAGSEADLASEIWSDFITTSGSKIASPLGRWIEVEATLSTTDKTITPLLHNLTVTYGDNPGDILWQTDVPINQIQGISSNLTNTIGTLGRAGKLYFQGTLSSATGQTLASAEYPFYLEQGNFQLLLAADKRIYRPGETVTIRGEAKNLSNVDAAGLVLKVHGTLAGVGTLYTETFDLPASGGHPFSFTTNAGNNGTYGLRGVVTQNSTTLAEIADQYEAASPMVTATLAAPDTAGNAPFVIAMALNNPGRVNAVTSMRLTDDSGGVIGSQEVMIPAGETRILQYTGQITGATTFTALFTGDLNQTITKSVAYSTTSPGSSVNAKIVTDKISYNPNQQVTITSTATAQITSPIFENLTAWIIITNSTEETVFSVTANITTLIPGQMTTIKKYWNSGTNPAGNYRVALRIVDTTGTVISIATCDLVISSTTSPKALLNGQISLDKQNILTGEPVTVSYSVTNAGNSDLSNIALSVQTINLAEETVYNTFADQAALAMGASYTKTGPIDTTGYSAKDYLVVLRASIDGVEETLAGTFFRVEGAPSAPALISPVNGADVDTFTPALTVSNASDPNDEKLTYEFEIYAESGLTTLISSGTVSETAGATAWAPAAPLTENLTYFWRARAWDEKLYSPWMAPASFRVNTVNDPPTAPTIASPTDGTDVAVLTPALIVNNASDPDSANLTYNFDIALDPGFTQIVATAKGIAGGQGTTSWTVPTALRENGRYYWRAQADDWLIEGPWSTTARFQVNTANDAPGAPVITSPINGSTVTALETDVVVTNSIDPDSIGLTYYFEADTAPTFDSPDIIRSGVVSEGEAGTIWHINGLRDNMHYYLRVKAGDGAADSPWSAVTEFTANTVNDPPTTPILDNPSNGAGVTVFTPTLSVQNSTDSDKDVLTYEFEVYADAALTTLVIDTAGVTGTSRITSWIVPVSLTENQTYYWRARANDGSLRSPWMPQASFTINTANDAPGAPALLSPTDGSTISTLTPVLTLLNAVDPDSDSLSYEYEVYQGGVLVTSITNVPENIAGETSATITTNLADNTAYQWRARAFDGDRYGPWTAMATFTTHVNTRITVDIDFEPETLNKKDCGKWVVVKIELPHGYRAKDVDISSIRLEGTVHAELWPHGCHYHHHEHGCDHDRHGHHHEVLMVKFKRSEVIAVLPEGKRVPVHVTGMVKSTPFEGVDIIKVTSSGHCCGGH